MTIGAIASVKKLALRPGMLIFDVLK